MAEVSSHNTSPIKNVGETYSVASTTWKSKSDLIKSVKGDDNFIRTLSLAAISKTSAGKTIADLGCGDGKLLEEFASTFGQHNYIGVDLSFEMAKSASRKMARYNAKVLASPIEDCPLPPNSVDIATLKMVLHHLKNPHAAVKKIYSLLKDGGRLLVMVPGTAYQSNLLPLDNSNDSLGRFSVDELEDVVSEAGFEVASVHSNRFWMTFENMSNYLEFMAEIGAISKFFNYDVGKANLIKLFTCAYANLFRSTGEVYVKGEYLTIECIK